MGEHQQILLSIHIPENELCLCGSSENTTVVRSRCRCLLFNVHIVHELCSSSSSKYIETEPNGVGQQLTDSRVCISDCSVLRQIYSDQHAGTHSMCDWWCKHSFRIGSGCIDRLVAGCWRSPSYRSPSYMRHVATSIRGLSTILAICGQSANSDVIEMHIVFCSFCVRWGMCQRAANIVMSPPSHIT